MACTAEYLLTHDRDVVKLAHEFDLSIGRHPHLPLVVLNYRRGMLRSEPTEQDPHRRHVRADHPIVAECRGLVLEVQETREDPTNCVFVRVVARGFTRFWHLAPPNSDTVWPSSVEEETPDLLNAASLSNSNFCFDRPYEVQSKEDGSFMLVYRFRDQLMCSSRHGFGEEMLQVKNTDLGRHGESECTLISKSDLVLETMQLRDPHSLADGQTLCIEFCSEYTRIVRRYTSPTVFLIGVTDAMQGEVTHDSKAIDVVAKTLCDTQGARLSRPWIAPILYRGLCTVRALLEEKTSLDPTIEGFVLIDCDGRRLKIKSDMYVRAHRLKYLGYVTCTPSLCVPLLIRPGQMEALLDGIDFTPSQRKLIETRVDDCRKTLGRTRERVAKLWRVVVGDGAMSATLDTAACAIRIQTVACGYDTPLRPMLFALLQMQHPSASSIPATFWQAFESLLIKFCLEATLEPGGGADAQKSTDALHASQATFGYCSAMEVASTVREFNDGISLHPPVRTAVVAESKKSDQDQAAATWRVTCFCGHPMRLVSLKHYLHVPRTCHCGHIRPASLGTVVKTYVPRSLLWVCTNEPTCQLTMEAQQQQRGDKMRGDPLGIPASAACKNMRLVAHDLLGRLADKRAWDMDARYSWLARAMQLAPHEAHMSQMNATQCRTAIAMMQIELF